MFDHSTGENVDVRTDAQCGPYIMIEPANLARVKEILQRSGIDFKVDKSPGACIGTPEAAVIESGQGANVENIQRVLDSVQ